MSEPERTAPHGGELIPITARPVAPAPKPRRQVVERLRQAGALAGRQAAALARNPVVVASVSAAGAELVRGALRARRTSPATGPIGGPAVLIIAHVSAHVTVQPPEHPPLLQYLPSLERGLVPRDPGW